MKKTAAKASPAPAPSGWSDVREYLSEIGTSLEMLLADYPNAPDAAKVCSRLEEVYELIGTSYNAACRAAEEARRLEAEAQEDKQLREHIEGLRAASLVWSWEQAREELGLSDSMLAQAVQLMLLIPPVLPEELTAAFKRSTDLRGDLFEIREPLTGEERSRLHDHAKGVKLISQDAADELGVTVTTFRKWVKEAGIQPCGEYVTRAGWPGDFWSLADVDVLRVTKVKEGHLARIEERRRQERAKLRPIWDSLNERQRIYLRVLYDAHLVREDNYRDGYIIVSHLPNETTAEGGWRWLHHHGYDVDAGLRGRLKEIDPDLVDPGTGATYAALDERGLIERTEQSVEMVNPMGQMRTERLLWVRMTLTGRRLAAAIQDYPEEFPKT